jgi:polar amino acid transport system substrate-binding protein
MLKRGSVVAASLALLLAACGGAEDTASAPAPAPAPDTAPADADDCAVENLALATGGVLTVGTGEVVYPPWMLNDDPAGGEGFENGLVYALAAELGFDAADVAWVGQTFEEAIAPGLKPYDFAIQQISVTEPRKEIVSFSMVYFQPDKALVALPTSPVVGATTFAELREANWGATIGTTDLDYIEDIIGVTPADVAVFDDQSATFQALLGGQIDATVVSLPTALFATAVQIPEAGIVALLPADANDNGHGLLFEKDNPLVACVDAALERVIAAGTVDALIEQYLLPEETIPFITG